MSSAEKKSPALVVEYVDPREGFRGWLVIDSLDHHLCAGGMRVRKGLTRGHLERMAANMTCKMRICGLRVDGAKSGIDYDPEAPGKHAAMGRFLAAIEPYVRSRYSMGPDMNVSMGELEAVAGTIGLESVKMAVAAAQGWNMEYFRERYRVLEAPVAGATLGALRAGYGVAMAVLAVLDFLGIPRQGATAAIQGFGTLARATARTLAGRGVRIMALADCNRTLAATSEEGLDPAALPATGANLLPDPPAGMEVEEKRREDIFTVPCDVLVPAAVENAVSERIAQHLAVRAVVPGANLAVTEAADTLLHERDIVVVPDFLAGCGGSLSMEGLFAPDEHPAPEEVLAHVEKRMVGLVGRILARSREEGVSPTVAARRACAEIVPQPGTRPYGRPH